MGKIIDFGQLRNEQEPALARGTDRELLQHGKGAEQLYSRSSH